MDIALCPCLSQLLCLVLILFVRLFLKLHLQGVNPSRGNYCHKLNCTPLLVFIYYVKLIDVAHFGLLVVAYVCSSILSHVKLDFGFK